MIYRTIFLLFFLFILSNAFAADTKNQFALCKAFRDIAPQPPDLPPLKEGIIQLFADDATVEEKLGMSTFTGNVLVLREDQILKSDLVVYNRNNEIVDAEGDFTLWDHDFIISGAKVQLRPDNKGEMTKANYWLLNRRAQGYAEKLTQISKDIVKLEKATYTTCDPNNEAWRFQGRKITLDKAKDTGTARDVKLRFFNIPIFYFPYISFPLSDKRKSGFLLPKMESSDETGMEFSIPYYLNLAPNYDATLTPRYMSRRGLLLNTEFRYLTKGSSGSLEFEYMPHDQAFGGERSSVYFMHNGTTKNWSSNIYFNQVSDQRYFEELGTNITVASITHLEQRGDLYYHGAGWMGLGRVQQFQTLDRNPAARPYHRMPQLMLQTTLPEFNRRLNLGMRAELVRFDRDTEVIKGAIGNRLDLKSVFSYPWRTPGTFIVPKLSLSYTRYDLEEINAANETATHNRMLYTFSTDSGLFFERNVNLFSQELVQTLEPRIFYIYTPYKDQSDIPIFDTAPFDLSYLQLFREDNFAGPDRIEDKHQVSLGLSSRLLGGDTGLEHLRASIGQIYYFQDRRVTMPNQPVKTEPSSNIIVELASQFAQNWYMSSTFRWDPNTNDNNHTVWRLRYRSDNNRIFNFSYRFRDRFLEQTDISFYWPIGSRWNILARWNYSLPDEKTLESFSGIEYRSCCWAIRAIMQRYLNNIDGYGYSQRFLLQFQLSGLGTIGKKMDSLLELGIRGYYDQF